MRTSTQLLVIIALVGVCGTVYNLANSGNPRRHAPWVWAVYRDAAYLEEKQPPEQEPIAPPSIAAGAPTPSAKEKDKPQDISQTPPYPAEQPASSPSAPGELTLVDIARVVDELDSGSIVIDARRSPQYEAGHIPGAVSMSPHEADFFEKLNKLVSGAVLEAPVVIYCTNSKECEDSKLVARQLKQAGFLNTVIYLGGFPEWQSHKPDRVAKGKEPGSWQ